MCNRSLSKCVKSAIASTFLPCMHSTSLAEFYSCPDNQEHDGQLLFNPGSATDRRVNQGAALGCAY